MCGRTGLNLNKDQMCCACSYKPIGDSKYEKPQWLEEHNGCKSYTPSYNIAPTDVTPILVSAKNFENVKTERVLKPMMWGLIPPWHKGDYKSHNLSTNNCRLENIKNSKLYSPILKKGGRCIVPVEGFYEWQTTNQSSKTKQPYYIYASQNEGLQIDDPATWKNDFQEDRGWLGVKLLFMAGLYSIWQDGDTTIYSYTVITMDSNSTLNWLHHRMPAILDNEEQIQAWLNIDEVDQDMALAYLKPVTLLSWHKVSTDVNNSKNKSNNCNKRLVETTKKSQSTIMTWFKPSPKRKLDDCSSVEPKRYTKNPDYGQK